MTVPDIQAITQMMQFIKKKNLKATYILTLQGLKVNHVEPSSLGLGLVPNLHTVL